MNNFFAESDLIKKYKSFPALVKALGKTMEEVHSLAKGKSWVTETFKGNIGEYEVSLTFHVRNKKGEFELSNPKLNVHNFPHKGRGNGAAMMAAMALAMDQRS